MCFNIPSHLVEHALFSFIVYGFCGSNPGFITCLFFVIIKTVTVKFMGYAQVKNL